MIVYVESNFILEIVLAQKYAAPAENILQLAENGKIELAFPSFALGELNAYYCQYELNFAQGLNYIQYIISKYSQP